MPPNLLLIRHAQGYHNLNTSGHQFHDPGLTLHGESQCQTLATKIAQLPAIDYIIASPLRRTLYTALLTFATQLEENPSLRIIARPELQETSDLPCDTGSSVEDLEREFVGKPIDFSRVGEAWMDKVTGPFSPHSEQIVARCREARMFLRGLEKENVAVVTHGAVLHYLTDDWVGATTGVGTGWENCEMRSYVFDGSSEGSVEGAKIMEIAESRKKRTGTEHCFSEGQQMDMRQEAESSWARDGYIVLGDEGQSLVELEAEKPGMRCVVS